MRRSGMAKKGKRRRNRFKPLFSAFIWGVLVAVGVNPGQMLIETALHELEVYFQLAALGLLVILLYFSFEEIVEGIRRSKRAYRTAGLLGVAGILLAFLGGLLALTNGEEAVAALAVGLALWLYATW